jgi:exopolysaccharide production protein ExoZ
MSASSHFEILYSKNSKRIAAFDGLRAYFVILTFLTHFIASFASMAKINILGELGTLTLAGKLMYGLRNSNYGVSCFFILSGFLIARITFDNLKFSTRNFLLHRFFRLYPAFLVSAFVSWSVGYFYTHYMKINLVEAVMNLFFLNGFFMIGEIPSLNLVTWSLFYEMIFYFSVPLILFLSKPRGNLVNLLFWAYIISVLISVCLKLGPNYLLFFSGIAIAQFSDANLSVIAKKIPEKVVIFLWLFITSCYSFNFLSGIEWYLLILGPMLIVKTVWGDGYLYLVFTNKFLCKLGRISYSFYLMHVVVITVFFITLNNFGVTDSLLVALISVPVVFGLCYAASYLLFKFAEEPYFKYKTKF